MTSSITIIVRNYSLSDRSHDPGPGPGSPSEIVSGKGGGVSHCPRNASGTLLGPIESGCPGSGP